MKRDILTFLPDQRDVRRSIIFYYYYYYYYYFFLTEVFAWGFIRTVVCYLGLREYGSRILWKIGLGLGRIILEGS